MGRRGKFIWCADAISGRICSRRWDTIHRRRSRNRVRVTDSRGGRRERTRGAGDDGRDGLLVKRRRRMKDVRRRWLTRTHNVRKGLYGWPGGGLVYQMTVL